jgi:hypothetical protein
MLTDEQLADQLRAQLRREVATIEPSGDLLASLRGRRPRRSLGRRLSIVAVPAVAAALVAAVLVVAGGGNTGRPSSSVVTVAMVHKIATASRVALEHSGRVKVGYRELSNGALVVRGSEAIAFGGKTWTAVISQSFPAKKGQRAFTQTAINRIVNGQFYLHTEGRNGRVEWIHETNPNGHPKMPIPDPRRLFGLLKPSAKFKIVGHRVIDGVRLTELRATKAPKLPALSGLPGVTRGAQVAFLTIWVDGRHIVHQMSMRLTKHHTATPIYLKKFANGSYELVVPIKTYLKKAKAMARSMRKHNYHVTVGVDPSLSGKVRHYFYVTSASVTFSEFGKRQVIKAPRHSVPVFGRS